MVRQRPLKILNIDTPNFLKSIFHIMSGLRVRVRIRVEFESNQSVFVGPSCREVVGACFIELSHGGAMVTNSIYFLMVSLYTTYAPSLPV